MATAKPFVLRIQQTGHPVRTQSLRAGTYIVGRDPDRAEVVLLSGHVSRQHATLHLSLGDITISDRHSKNGVFVNGKRRTRAVLRPEDSLTLGDFHITIAVRATGAAHLPEALGLLQPAVDDEATDPQQSTAHLLQGGAAAGGGDDVAWGPAFAADWQLDVPDALDLEEDTEASFVPPYSLSRLMLNDHRGLLTQAKPAAPKKACIELLAMVETELTDFALLEPGGPGWQRAAPPAALADQRVGRGLLRVVPSRAGDCLVECDERLRGVLVRDRVEHDVAHFFAPRDDARFAGLLTPGDVLHLSHQHETFCLRYIEPPRPKTLGRSLKKRWREQRGSAASSALVALLNAALLFAVRLAPPLPAVATPPHEFVVATAQALHLAEPRAAARRRASTTPTPVAQVIDETPAAHPQLSKSHGLKLLKQAPRKAPPKPRPAPRVARRRHATVGVVGAKGRTGSTTAPGHGRALLPSVATLPTVASPAPLAPYKLSGLLAHPPATTPALSSSGGSAAPTLRGGEAGGNDGSRSDEGAGLEQKSGQGVVLHGGALDLASVTRVVTEHIEAIQACYEQGLRRDPSMAGNLWVSWVIDLDGRVSDVHIVKSALDSLADSCVVEEVRTWKFPQPHGSPVRVRYPFVTKSVAY